MLKKVLGLIVAFSCFISWFLAWNLYDEFELWRTYSSVVYQNYLLIFMGVLSLCEVLAGLKIKREEHSDVEEEDEKTELVNPFERVEGWELKIKKRKR